MSIGFWLAGGALCFWLAANTEAAAAASRGSVETVAEQKAEALLRQMTLDEKLGQMTLFSPAADATGPTPQNGDLEAQIRSGACGNVFNAHTGAAVRRLQQMAVEDTRLKIPLLFGYDVIHGHKTIFPIPLGEAASWDVVGIEQSARVAAAEASACGLNWTFAPMVDIARDPRWGRIAEGAGEDTFLGSAIARARVRGFQGANLADPTTILACVKHFAAYGAALAGRDYNTVDLSERTLREIYLPPYAAAVDAGALSVMTSFNDLNGTPATANRFLLQQVLRDEWGFRGFVVTDYTAIKEMVQHGTARDEAEAARQALAAGVDMDMQSGDFLNHLKAELASGAVTERQVDDAVRRILKLKFMLGLFDDPYRYCDAARETNAVFTPANLDAAYRMACESLVLLKNERAVLPLRPGVGVAVIGPLAEAREDLLGSWRADGDAAKVRDVLTSLRELNASGHVHFARGCDIDSERRDGFAAAIKAAKKSDVVIILLGESAGMSGEAASRTSISLPGVQRELLRELHKTGKPIVLVLINGRPLALEEETRLADAVLEAWQPGTMGGQAVADVLFGRKNPSGKLPVTFPRDLGQVPIFYNAKNTGRPFSPARADEKYVSRYLDCPNDPLFPFGFGLSYTSFTCSKPELSVSRLMADGELTIRVAVTNTGSRDGTEVVQLYVGDLVGSVTRPVKELKGFERVALKAGERREVEFMLRPADLAFYRADMSWGTEPGEFQVFVGFNSRDVQSALFELVVP
jgi:beta-glucosidase